MRPVFDPFDPAFRANPYPFYDALRTHDPVHTTPFGMVVLTRYEDVAWTLKSPDFSRDIDKYATQNSSPARQRRREQGRTRTKSILNLDPPDHTRLRRLVAKSFTPSAIERLRSRVRELVDQALVASRDTKRLELIDDVAFPVPFQVISELLDMPTDRADELRDWSQAITKSLEPTASEEELDASDAAIDFLIPYLTKIIEDRRRKLGGDMLSSLITVEEAGEQMTTDELMAFVVLLYIAGHETTVNLIGNAMLALLRNPDQMHSVQAHGIDSHGVDELLRFDGPVQLTVRIPLTEVTYQVDGESFVVNPGTTVMTSLGGANHDPTLFVDPQRLNLTRANASRHMAFASGIHYCLGASLARLEAEETIGAVARNFAQIEMVREPEWRDRLTIRGVSRLEMSVR
ncbi:MAG: cytochrome P450 [Ilumatobacteraceae bacterium]